MLAVQGEARPLKITARGHLGAGRGRTSGSRRRVYGHRLRVLGRPRDMRVRGCPGMCSHRGTPPALLASPGIAWNQPRLDFMKVLSVQGDLVLLRPRGDVTWPGPPAPGPSPDGPGPQLKVARSQTGLPRGSPAFRQEAPAADLASPLPFRGPPSVPGPVPQA